MPCEMSIESDATVRPPKMPTASRSRRSSSPAFPETANELPNPFIDLPNKCSANGNVAELPASKPPAAPSPTEPPPGPPAEMLQSSSEPPTTLSSLLVQSPVDFNTVLAKQVGLSVVALRHDAELNTHSLIADEHCQSSISETVGNSGEALSKDVEESQEMAAEGGTHYSSLSGKVEQPLMGSELVPVSLIDSVSSGDRSGEAVDDSIPSALSEVAVVRHDTARETKKPLKSRARKDRAPKLADKSVHAEVSEGRMSTRCHVHAPLKARGFDPYVDTYSLTTTDQ